jgi:hypothetical protein
MRENWDTLARLAPVEVKTDSSKIIGFLYFKTSTHVVLLNNLLRQVDLGPWKRIVDKHHVHEADITIIPVTDVTGMDVLEVLE